MIAALWYLHALGLRNGVVQSQLYPPTATVSKCRRAWSTGGFVLDAVNRGRAMHAISLGHWILSPLWLGLEPGRKVPLPPGLLIAALAITWNIFGH
jgi:hypothetical protein